MKIKLLSISLILLLIVTGLPTIQAKEEPEGLFFDSMTLAHVAIQGSGTEFLLRDSFTFGFGKCLFMRIALENNGHVEINKFLDPYNVTSLEGSHVILLIGFVGYYHHENTFLINGVAVQALWR